VKEFIGALEKLFDLERAAGDQKGTRCETQKARRSESTRKAL